MKSLPHHVDSYGIKKEKKKNNVKEVEKMILMFSLTKCYTFLTACREFVILKKYSYLTRVYAQFDNGNNTYGP